MYKNLIVLAVLLFSTQAMAEDRALAQMRSENRVALVIGNNAYQRPLTRLNNTINDAQAIRNILTNRGFEVIYRENLSHRDFNTVLEEFYQKLGYGGVGLLYFSGHGLEFNGQNYLIPTDAKIGAKSDTQYEAVALNKITDRIKKIGNRLNIVILDACRNDPFAKAFGVGGLAKAEPIGLFVSYATGAGQVSSDGRVGGNGLFTQYLIENMKKPLTLQDVFKATRASVYEASGGSQFPAIYDQIVKGDFYFTLPSVQTASTQTTYVAPQPIVVEPTSSISSSTSKWFTPTDKAVTWEKANKLCHANGGRLPTLEEFKRVITDCGGILNEDLYGVDASKNETNTNYQSCYKREGFNSTNYYWSFTNHPSYSDVALLIYFAYGYVNDYNKRSNYYVHCIREGE